MDAAVNNTGIAPATSPSVLDGAFSLARSYFDYKASKNQPTALKPADDAAADQLKEIELRNQQVAASSNKLIQYGLLAGAAILAGVFLLKRVK